MDLWIAWSICYNHLLFCPSKAESPKEKTGGMAYEVILKPASSDARPASPPKERPISQEFIEKKLKDAEERRLVGPLGCWFFILGMSGVDEGFSTITVPSFVLEKNDLKN